MFKSLALLIIFAPIVCFAYSDKTTHPALTDEIVDFVNLYFNDNSIKITDVEKELMKKGSTDEDIDPRWMHHFYDPVYNRGLWGFTPSVVWVGDTMAQASIGGWWFTGTISRLAAGTVTGLFSAESDHSWERAIYEYAWGDKNRALYDLGHILHLIEDASVPDHTRNDPHPHITEIVSVLNESPYEGWTAKFGPEEMEGLATSTKIAGLKPITFDNLESYFESMATYSNNNFFSKDTIFHKDYNNPIVKGENLELLSDGSWRKFGYGFLNNNKYKLVKIDRNLGSKENAYSIKDKDNLILSDYWDRLSKQAVLHGAGVVKLFFDEVEKEKKTQALYNKNKSWFAKAYDATKSKIFGIAGLLYGTSVDSENLAELNNSVTPPPPPAGGPPPLTVRGGGEERDVNLSLGSMVNNTTISPA